MPEFNGQVDASIINPIVGLACRPVRSCHRACSCPENAIGKRYGIDALRLHLIAVIAPWSSTVTLKSKYPPGLLRYLPRIKDHWLPSW